MKLLLVEDDMDLIRSLSRALDGRGFGVVTCADGVEALSVARRRRFDAIVLDLGIPGMDGLHLLQRLRRGDDATPVLILTARGAVGARVAGLNAGADDYLAKPFDLDELEARVRALIRRASGEGDWRCGHLRYERTSGVFYNAERALDLAPREAALLRALIARCGHAVLREKLHHEVFDGDDAAQSDAIEVVVHRLRKRLLGSATEIMTLRGVGYLLREDRDELVRGRAS
jgi:DNA-binding response OmpR family regulator